jgi:multidrug resistance efflux pump
MSKIPLSMKQIATKTIQGAAASPVKLQAADNQTALLALLKAEADARDATSVRDLLLVMANETRKLTRARQIFVVMRGLSGRLEVQAVSSLPTVDRNAPLIIFMESIVRASEKAGKTSKAHAIAMPLPGADATGDSYPFREMFWIPLVHGAAPRNGGLVLAREEHWNDQDLVVARRLAGAYAHALQALTGPKRTILRRMLKISRWHALAAIATVVGLYLIQVPLSALAPVEIVARDPFIVAAPIDGVVDSILIEPNQAIKKGDMLVKIADTTLRNRYEVAAREVQVAEARLKQSNQVAFTDPRGMHEIGIARAELALKLAERDFARDLLEKTEIRSQRDGIAVYADKRDIVGKPVAVGERLLEVADATALEARIELPVSDALTLTTGARVKIFLDSDPLKPWLASVRRADYKAKVGENDVVSFRVVADLKGEQDRQMPRLGVRGTAQLSGDNVSLAFYLFRRPITALRQWIGW